MTLSQLKTHYLAVAAAGALGLFLAAAPASAQDDEYVDDPAYAEQDDGTAEEYADPNDVSDAEDMDEAAADEGDDADDTQVAEADMDVIVSAPRVREQRDGTLRPGRMVASRAVSFSDLDLRSREGAHELRNRVREAADEICGGLSDMYPADAGDYGACYRESVRNGLVRAQAAITDARHYAYQR
jgi:UrcA family protein